MSVHREPCGCRHDGRKWLSMCEACAAEYQERHQRALAEHQSMGIRADNGEGVTPTVDPKGCPNPGSVTAPGLPSSSSPA